MTNALCDEAGLQRLVEAMQSDAGNDLELADRLLADHPDDHRLHFLRGSILAGVGRPIEALPALRRAVELAPDFALARFQLGFFQLTSGEAADALASWGPLALLPEENYLRRFVAGLTHLIRDEFDAAAAQLREGIAANDENPPLNRDMQLILDQVVQLRQPDVRQEEESGAASAASFLLDQLSGHRKPS